MTFVDKMSFQYSGFRYRKADKNNTGVEYFRK